MAPDADPQKAAQPPLRIARWLAAGTVLTALVFAFDVATGSEFTVSLFYLVPVALVTLRAGRGWGIAFSIAAACAWLVASLWTGLDATHPQVLVWNTAAQAGFFAIIAWTLAAVRRGLDRERALAARLADSYRSLDKELEVVGDLQRSMLPAAPPVVPGIEIAVHYATSTRAGGDYYDFFKLAHGRLGILIADVSGHGAPAAVVMAMLRVLLHTEREALECPERVLTRANDRLLSNIPDGQFITACYAVLDPANRHIEYAIAGHGPPLVVHPDRKDARAFENPCGPPLAVAAHACFARRAMDLVPGDTVLFSTDGLSEAMDGEGRLLGDERVLELLLAERGHTAEKIKDRLVEAVARHGAGRALADDLTILVLRVEGEPTRTRVPA